MPKTMIDTFEDPFEITGLGLMTAKLTISTLLTFPDCNFAVKQLSSGKFTIQMDRPTFDKLNNILKIE